jgi:hypothetical protein
MAVEEEDRVACAEVAIGDGDAVDLCEVHGT